MKIRIETLDTLKDNEIIITCRQMDETIFRIQQFIQEQRPAVRLTFYKDDSEFYLPLTDVLFFETSDDMVYAHTEKEAYRIKLRLYELEDILPGNFTRISKSTILNSRKVYCINKNIASSSLVQFQSTYKQVYVSRNYLKNLQMCLDRKE